MIEIKLRGSFKPLLRTERMADAYRYLEYVQELVNNSLVPLQLEMWQDGYKASIIYFYPKSIMRSLLYEEEKQEFGDND